MLNKLRQTMQTASFVNQRGSGIWLSVPARTLHGSGGEEEVFELRGELIALGSCQFVEILLPPFDGRKIFGVGESEERPVGGAALER